MCEAWDGAMKMYWDEGYQEGLEKGSVQALILDNLEEGKPEKIIIMKLQRWFSLSEEQAQEYYERYASEAQLQQE